MKIDLDKLDRRRFLRGTAAALTLPCFESFGGWRVEQPKRFVCA